MRKLIAGLIIFTCTFMFGSELNGVCEHSFAVTRLPDKKIHGLCEGAAYSYGHSYGNPSAVGRGLAYTRCEDFGDDKKAVEVVATATGSGKVLWQEPVTNPIGRSIGVKVVVEFGDHYVVMWTEGGVYRRVDALSLGAALDVAEAIIKCEGGCPPSA